MHISASTWLLVFVLAPWSATAKQYSKSKDAVRLADVKALTFYKDKKTTGRRNSAIPQMVVAGGAAAPYFTPDVIRCTNSGSSYDDADVEWTCKAQLPPEFKLGSTDVICEGYDSPRDPFILKGSCGIEYRLAWTKLGEKKFKEGRLWEDRKAPASSSPLSLDDLMPLVFWGLFCSVAVWILWSFISNYFGNSRPDARRRPVRRRSPHRGSDYHDDGGDDPPPPYSPQPPPSQKKAKTDRTRSSRNNANAAGGWQPGFWTGALGGAVGATAAQYMRGQGGSRGSTAAQRQAVNDPGEGPSRATAGPAGGAGTSFSEARYESTGFGGTRRR